MKQRKSNTVEIIVLEENITLKNNFKFRKVVTEINRRPMKNSGDILTDETR